MEDPPVHEKNTQVCPDNFLPTDSVSSVFEGFRLTKHTLKPDAVSSVFSFVPLPKQRKISEVHIEHQVTIKQLVCPSQDSSESRPSSSISSAALATRDIGI